MPRPAPAVLLMLCCTLCVSPIALGEEEDSEREHKSQPHPEPVPPPAPAASGYTQPPYVPPANPHATPAAAAKPELQAAQPRAPQDCAGKSKFRYDYDYGGLTALQPPLIRQRVMALHDCQGIYLEHSAVQSLETLGNPLWIDRGGYVLGDWGDTHDGYVYLAYTTVHGLESSHHGTLGFVYNDRSLAPLGYEITGNLAIRTLWEAWIFSNPADRLPADYELTIAMRLEMRHGALRAGYQQAKRNNFWRNGIFFGFSLEY